MLVLEWQMLKVIIRAFLYLLNNKPLKPVNLPHNKGQVITLHLRTYTLLNRINLHKEH